MWSDLHFRGRPQTAIPQVAVVAPLIAFTFGGTAVPIDAWVETALQVACAPILVLVTWSLWQDTRHTRMVSGVVMIMWWVAFIVALLGVESPRTSAFGVLALAAIPVVIAFTWGQAWGVHDIEERDRA